MISTQPRPSTYQLKKLLQITRVSPDWVNTEYARTSANLSLLELTQGYLLEALAAAMESIAPGPRAQGLYISLLAYMYSGLKAVDKNCVHILCIQDYFKNSAYFYCKHGFVRTCQIMLRQFSIVSGIILSPVYIYCTCMCIFHILIHILLKRTLC